MFAISFDLTIDVVKKTYTKSVASAYSEVKDILQKHGFEWIQGSVYAYKEPNNALRAVNRAIDDLKNLSWFCESVRDIRVFQILEWSDFTPDFK
jgi:virulence-associated protein VapD